jgi:hypothetical protein
MLSGKFALARYYYQENSDTLSKLRKGSTMKAVATALVLIAGAAVVLWYGNTLNSWVLGGLIGGLAALLLSIPISLVVFSYFSRRHDEHLRTEAQEEMALAQVYDYPQVPARLAREAYTVDEEAYRLSIEEEQWREEERYRQIQAARNLPVPSSPRSLVADQSRFGNQLPVTQRGTYTSGTRQPQQKALPPAKGKDATGRQATTRRMYYPGFPGYQPRGQQQTEALRAARQEAAQQYDDVEVLPTHTSKRLPAVRPQQPPPAQQRSRQQPLQSTNSLRTGFTTDRYSVQYGTHRSLPAAGESSSNHPHRQREPRTDQLDNNYYPQTGPMQPSMQTDQLTRNPHLEEQGYNFDDTTGALHNPLVRRAPYMYEDDSLRQELAQYIEPPVKRRSSLLRHRRDAEE